VCNFSSISKFGTAFELLISKSSLLIMQRTKSGSAPACSSSAWNYSGVTVTGSSPLVTNGWARSRTQADLRLNCDLWVSPPRFPHGYRDNLSCSQYSVRERLWTFWTVWDKSVLNIFLFPPRYTRNFPPCRVHKWLDENDFWTWYIRIS